jgi:tetratricopeptide (TPR) repeat protein
MSDKQDFVAKPLEARSIYDSHVDQYRKALADEGIEGAHKRLGFVFFHSLSARERVEWTNRLNLLRGDAVDEYNLGTAAASRDHLEDARKHLEKALKMSPNFFEAAYQMAAVLERMGDLEKANEWGRRALELAPEDQRLYVEEQLTTLEDDEDEDEDEDEE